MAKILSKSGVVLADIYDIEGSVAGIDQLQSQDVNLVHEMGSTLHAERLVGQIVTLAVVALGQSLNFSTNFSFSQTARLLAMQVISDDAARLAHASVHITSPPALDNTDVPIWFWEDAKDTFRLCRNLTNGVVNTEEVLVAALPPLVPNLLIGFDSRRQVSTVSFRGTSAAFGAGTVDVRVNLYMAFAQTGGVSSFGLPLPSW